MGGIYKVRRLIGSGGMGEVYAADGKSGEKVAIKVLHDKAAQDKDLVARFHREAAIAAQIKSPHIANILGAGKDRDGRLWIAFELLSGEGLDERLRREQYLSFAEVAPVVDDALQGLAAAHKAGVVHRDIKPANLFIEKRRLSAREIANDESEERTRILDFGVSKIRTPQGPAQRAVAHGVRRDARQLRVHGARAGSRQRARRRAGRPLRARRGRVPRALGAAAVRGAERAHAHRAQARPRAAHRCRRTTGDDWPAAIEQFLAKMMARDREKRFASADEALATWRRVCRTMGNAPRRRPRMLPVREERTDVTARSITSISSVSKVGSRP